jgi:NHLM bacteriocin system ABC transporter ATP-binding protein
VTLHTSANGAGAVLASLGPWQALGTVLPAGSNQPMLLSERDAFWVVLSGKVDIFALPLAAGRPAGARRHLFRLTPGQAYFCFTPPAGLNLGLLAVGAMGSRLLEIPTADAAELGLGLEAVSRLAGWLDGWVTALAAATSRALPPKDCQLLKGDTTAHLAAGGRAHALRGVVWITPSGGPFRWLERKDVPPLAEGLEWPVTPAVWVQAEGEGQLLCEATERLVRRGRSWAALRHFHNLSVACIQANAAGEAVAGRHRLTERAVASQRSLEGAFSRLAAVMEGEELSSTEREDMPLLAACRLVGQALKIEVYDHPSVQKGVSRNPLGDIARASRFRVRQVALKGEWWRQDNGPLLGYTEEGRRPLALLPARPRGYVMVDPADGKRQKVTAEVANTINSFATTFYRPLPNRTLRALDLFRFGLRATRSDLTMVVIMGIAVGLLGALVPLATGLVVDAVIPGANRSGLLQVALALLAAAIAGLLFQITQSIAFLRFEGNMDASLQAAVWDRLLSLPVGFFRDFTAGDLGNRAMSISSIRQTLSGTTIGSILAGLFSIFSFALLFYFDSRLAWLAAGLVLVAVVVTAGASTLQVRYQRQLVELQGRISGMVLQLITGIAKFRIAGAEERAFVYWARAFSEQKRTAYQARAVANSLSVFNAAYPTLATMAIFAALALSAEAELSTGEFVGFNVAFSQFLTGALQVSFALVSTLNIVPLYERARPIFQTLPESDVSRPSPGELSGEIEVSQVSFRYKEGGPLILKEVSLHIKPGEFIALVGPSGSGKSTLFRLLVGFEQPEAGAIYFDGQDLTTIDIQEVRRQMGVVLQNGRLLAGTILENIIGSSLMTIDEAWEAARMSGLDEDVKAMPMGLHTLVSEGGGTLSGGQRQRLLIARAVVTRPRIIFFDEATSALDNRTQAIVSASLERLQATRIVIAHRLSTIINADRIFVMEGGRLVQVGTYQELIDQPGLFAELARRQLV